MKRALDYRSTARACYIANLTQAVVISLSALLFIPLKAQFGFSYSQFGFLVLCNFATQVGTDIIFSPLADRYGFRPFIVGAHIATAAGFVLFAAVPLLFTQDPYLGFLLATILFSAGGGLFELLLSPIVDALPNEEKSKAMAILHSFYAWGQAAFVAASTCMLFIGLPWQAIVLLWALIPLANGIFFLVVPLAHKKDSGVLMPMREWLRSPVFVLCFLAILFGGASEVTMAQWASAFLERGLGFPKIAGDLFGLCLFAIFLGLGRVLFSRKGLEEKLGDFLLWGSFGAIWLYVIAAFFPLPWVSLLACALTGFSVSLLWPGTLSLASKALPRAGAALFALLAAGGDIGAAAGPWLTGVLSDAFMPLAPPGGRWNAESFGLRSALCTAVLLPVVSFLIQLRLKLLLSRPKSG